MNCIGCDAATAEPAAFAIMHVDDFAAMGLQPAQRGPSWADDPGRAFAAGPVCKPCHVDPAHRKRPIKAHFALPGSVNLALAAAGSHREIGG